MQNLHGINISVFELKFWQVQKQLYQGTQGEKKHCVKRFWASVLEGTVGI